MFLNSKITWEKLRLELEIIKTAPPLSLIPILYGFNALLDEKANIESSSHTLLQLSYELKKNCDELPDEDKLNYLNEYFFEQQGFQLSDTNNQNKKLDCWLPEQMIQNKEGAPLLIALLYQYLAFELNLPLQIIFHPHFTLVKWIRPGKKSRIIDLSLHGLVLKDKEISEIFNKYDSGTLKERGTKLFNSLNTQDILKFYLKSAYSCLKNKEQLEKSLPLLHALIFLLPEKAQFLLERAQVYKTQGALNDAYKDFRKYLSFTEIKNLSQELKTSLYELQTQLSFNKAKQETNPDLKLLH
ncbi:MAG: hypothetical protein HOO06_11070 [Bdellovibrionaceae bacterium]|jgi:regulator of sirC expression with transglutaminase-like and TPR domain|nr:hypothetical protein [Pseudobdellovibrionaceae bacterium]